MTAHKRQLPSSTTNTALYRLDGRLAVFGENHMVLTGPLTVGTLDHGHRIGHRSQIPSLDISHDLNKILDDCDCLKFLSVLHVFHSESVSPNNSNIVQPVAARALIQYAEPTELKRSVLKMRKQ
jgi:hypothetical protein